MMIIRRPGDQAIREAEIGGPLSGTTVNQQLVFDEPGFGDQGTHAAWTRQARDRRQQMQDKDGQIAHRTVLATARHLTLTN